MIVVIANEKGGCAKSTTAVNLAVERASAGKEVALVNADPQKSIEDWSETRNDREISPVISTFSITNARIGKELRRLQLKYDDVVVDVGAQFSTCMESAMSACDILVTPVVPSYFDTNVTEKMDAIVGDMRAGRNPNMRAILFFSIASAQNNGRVERAARAALNEFCEEYEFLESVKTVNRGAYRIATALGCGVSELPKSEYNEKAAAESLALYKEVFKDA